MSLELPPAALRKLEQTVAQWPQWRGAAELPGAPHLAARLGGISNYTVLAEAAGQRFCLRLERVNPAANGLNRRAEWRALENAHAAGLAPRPRYFNPDIGALVCDYLPPDEDQSVTPEELAGLLRKIHRLPGLHYRLDLPERIRRYRHQLGESLPVALRELGAAASALLDELGKEPSVARLCHNDLSSDNLIRSGGRLYALDWEYCAMGSHWFDLAAACAGSGLEPEQRDSLLEHYQQRPVSDADRHTRERWCCIAGYLELLWYLSQTPGYLTEEAVSDRSAGLLARLRRHA